MLESGILGSLLTGVLGLCGMCISKTKCFYKQNGEISSGFGFLDAPILDDGEIELKTIHLNGVDMVYIVKKKHHSSSMSVVSNHS